MLRGEILPVLRDGRAAHARAGQRRRVVGRGGERVPGRRREPVSQTPAQLNLTGVPPRAAVRREMGEPERAGRTRVDGAGGIGVRQHLLHQPAAGRTEIRRENGQRSRQVALCGHLPVLGKADAQVRVDGERVRRARCRIGKAVGERERRLGRVLDVDRLRQRRLLSHGHRDRLVDVRVAIDAVTRANHQRRAGHRPPGQTETRLKAARIGAHERRRILRSREHAHRIARENRRRGGEARRNVQVDQAPELFSERRFVFPSHAQVEGQGRRDAKVVVDVRSTIAPRRSLSGLPNASELLWGMPSRKSARSDPLVEPVNVNTPRASCWPNVS